MFRSTVFCSALVMLLVGCTSSEINLVKKSHLVDYPNYLIGQAFDNRHACASIDWKSFKDDRKRTVVEYTCQYKFAPEFYTKLVSEFVRQRSVSFESEKARVEQMIKAPQERAVKYRSEQDALSAEPAMPSWPSFVETQTAELEKLQSIKSFSDYLSAKGQGKVIYADELRFTAKKCAAENVETCKPFDHMLAVAIREIENSIKTQKRMYYEQQADSENQARESKLQEYASWIESGNVEYEEAMAAKESLILKATSEKDVDVKKYQDRLENFQSANEKIQWVVIDGQPKLAGIFLVIKNKDGEFQRPTSSNIVFGEIYKNSVEITDLQKYLLEELWLKQK